MSRMSTYVDCQYMNHLNNYVGAASGMSTKVDLHMQLKHLHVETVSEMSTEVDLFTKSMIFIC